MRRHILLPTDFSANAWSAIHYALNLFSSSPCTFFFMHAWTFKNTSARTYISPTYIDRLKETALNELQTVKEKAMALSENPDHQFETIFRADYLLESITHALKQHPINYIVMGTQGATGAKEFFIGSNAVTVINKIRHCPILLIPENYQYLPPKTIGFASDLKRKFGTELNPIKALVEMHQASLRVLHIMGEEDLSVQQNANKEELKQLLGDCKYEFDWQPFTGSKEQVIGKFIQAWQIDLMAMINYKHDFFEDLVKEPVIKRMGFHTVIPFLVVPAEV